MEFNASMFKSRLETQRDKLPQKQTKRIIWDTTLQTFLYKRTKKNPGTFARIFDNQ